MVESPAEALRRLIDLCEGRKEVKKAPKDRSAQQVAQQPQAQKGLKIRVSNVLYKSLERFEKSHPGLADRLVDFSEFKQADPTVPFESSDYKFAGGGPLRDYKHSHLRQNAMIIYNIAGGYLNLYVICNHDDIDGNNARKMAKYLSGLTLREPNNQPIA
jgi:mRNA-degrading endonuclease YafQ of YafQ-DinJ toxin-antitoxin module